MQGNEGPISRIEKEMVASLSEASLRLEITDLLLSRLREMRMGRLTLEQGAVLQQIEAALEAYGSYFYPRSPPMG